MRRFGERLHIEQVTGLVVRMRQHEQRDIVAQRLNQALALDQPPLGQLLRLKTLDHVDISREISRFADDRFAPRPHMQSCRDQLEQVDADRIGRDHFVRFCTDQRRDLGTYPCAHREPPSPKLRLVP